MILNTEGINHEIRLLWKETIDANMWPDGLRKLWPHQYSPVDVSTQLVFIGMNPAYAVRDEKVRREKDIEDTSVLLEEQGAGKLCEKVRFPDAPYFRALDNFANDVNQKTWIHLDIFAVRETNQKTVRNSLRLDEDTWTDFAEQQFMLFNKLLSNLNPAIIVVPNSYASQLLSKRLSLGSMSTEYCCHFIQIGAQQVPMFLCGMLSGQHPMDRFSRERLVYLIQQITS